MHVVIDAQLLSTALSYRAAGVSNYSRHLLQQLGNCTATGTRATLTAFISDPHFYTDNIRLQRTPSIIQNPFMRIAWEQMVLPLHLQRMRADGVHGLVNILPLSGRTPGLVTVHDLSFLHLPEKLPASRRWYLSHLCRASVEKAQHVIAVSQQTADDLMRFFGLPASKISVIHNGVAGHFRPGDPAAVADFRRQRGLPARFVFYLGTLEPRKNLEMLVRAYAGWLRSATGEDREIHLVLAGAKGWYYETIFQQVAALGLAGQVHFPGFIAERELPDWYRAAELFVYPSLFEGFGLPVLEAMACGTPVLCSQAKSLLEIGDEAVLTFPVESETGLADGFHRFFTDEALRAELRQRGLAQAAQFTWQRTAAATYQCYHTTFG
jgi:glycosyltransferase involved in cell wall biosynthesis